MYDPEKNEHAPQHMGMHLAQLDDDRWRNIVKIYHEAALGRTPDDFDLESRYHARTVHNGAGSYRIGSRFSVHSKLRVRDVYSSLGKDHTVIFDFQVDSEGGVYERPGTEEHQQAETLREEFRLRVDRYLLREGLGVELTS